jgi:hypothetical protein
MVVGLLCIVGLLLMMGAIILSRIDVVKLGLGKIFRWGVGLAAARLLGGEGNWVVVMLDINYLSSVDVRLLGEVYLRLPINN